MSTGMNASRREIDLASNLESFFQTLVDDAVKFFDAGRENAGRRLQSVMHPHSRIARSTERQVCNEAV